LDEVYKGNHPCFWLLFIQSLFFEIINGLRAAKTDASASSTNAHGFRNGLAQALLMLQIRTRVVH
jgi:hypothetical protein